MVHVAKCELAATTELNAVLAGGLKRGAGSFLGQVVLDFSQLLEDREQQLPLEPN